MGLPGGGLGALPRFGAGCPETRRREAGRQAWWRAISTARQRASRRIPSSIRSGVALEAVRLLLACHAGRPENALNLEVSTQPAPWTEVQMAMLTNEELKALAALVCTGYSCCTGYSLTASEPGRILRAASP